MSVPPYPVPFSVRFVIGAIDETIPAYLWGQQDGRVYFERMFGTSYAHLFRERVAAVSNALVCVFQMQSSIIDKLRDIALAAMRDGTPVTFYPDSADTGTSWTVDWPDASQFTRVTDGRDEFTAVLFQRRP